MPHLLSALSTSHHSCMAEGCLETQAGNGFSGALCGAFLSWVASAAPPHVKELPGPGLCLLSFHKLPAPGHSSLLTPQQQQASRKQNSEPTLRVISRLDLGQLEISWRWGNAVPVYAGLQLS